MPRRTAAMNGRMPPVTILEARLHRSPACEESLRDQSMRRPPRVTHEVVRALVARSVEMVLKVPQRHPIGRGHIAMSARGSSVARYVAAGASRRQAAAQLDHP